MPVVAAAALNALFDVFSEANKNAVLVATGAMARLRQAHGVLKTSLPSLRGQLSREDYGHVSEAVLNLGRFIVYKKNEGVA